LRSRHVSPIVRGKYIEVHFFECFCLAAVVRTFIRLGLSSCSYILSVWKAFNSTWREPFEKLAAWPKTGQEHDSLTQDMIALHFSCRVLSPESDGQSRISHFEPLAALEPPPLPLRQNVEKEPSGSGLEKQLQTEATKQKGETLAEALTFSFREGQVAC
jgi:hypothetical protein